MTAEPVPVPELPADDAAAAALAAGRPVLVTRDGQTVGRAVGMPPDPVDQLGELFTAAARRRSAEIEADTAEDGVLTWDPPAPAGAVARLLLAAGLADDQADADDQAATIAADDRS